MANEYATAAELKAAMSVEDLDDDLLMGIDLEAASRLIDGACQRRFWFDPAPVARVYSPTVHNGDVFVVTNDIASSTGLVVAADQDGDGIFEEIWTLGVDYQLRPFNAAADGWPWEWLSLTPQSLKRWPVRDGSVQVTAPFGWPVMAPAPVHAACLLQAERLVKRKDAPLAGGEPLGAAPGHIRKSIDPDVEALLTAYRKSWPFSR